MVQIDTGIFVTIIVGVFTILGGLVVLLVKINNRTSTTAMVGVKESLEKAIDSRLVSLEARLESVKLTSENALLSVKDQRAECEKRCAGSIRDMELSFEKLRDRWELFLEKYTVIDATRGNKVDALFRTVDEFRDVIRNVTPTVTKKVEDLFITVRAEMKQFIRDYTREELQRGPKR